MQARQRTLSANKTVQIGINLFFGWRVRDPQGGPRHMGRDNEPVSGRSGLPDKAATRHTERERQRRIGALKGGRMIKQKGLQDPRKLANIHTFTLAKRRVEERQAERQGFRVLLGRFWGPAV